MRGVEEVQMTKIEAKSVEGVVDAVCRVASVEERGRKGAFLCATSWCRDQADASSSLAKYIRSEVKGTVASSGSRKTNHGRLRHTHKLVPGAHCVGYLDDRVNEQSAESK